MISNSGSEFTKETGKALRDLGHVGLLMVTVGVMELFGDYTDEYLVGILIALAFTIARNVTYTLVCSTANMKFRQFTSTILVFSFGFMSMRLPT